MLGVLGGWSLSLGSALLLAISAAAPGGVPALVAALPSLPWGYMCLKSVLDLGFNFLIALGISLTHPLFISIGTILGTPLNVLVELLLRGSAPSPVEAAGIATILLLLLTLTLALTPTLTRRAASPPSCSPSCCSSPRSTPPRPPSPPAPRWGLGLGLG